MPLWIPIVAVAILLIADGENMLIVVVDGQIKCSFAFATIVIDIMMRIDCAFVEGHVHIVDVVLPTVTVTTGFINVNVVTRSEFKVEDEGTIAGIGEGEGVVINT
jgi:hypothetical protein